MLAKIIQIVKYQCQDEGTIMKKKTKKNKTVLYYAQTDGREKIETSLLKAPLWQTTKKAAMKAVHKKPSKILRATFVTLNA